MQLRADREGDREREREREGERDAEVTQEHDLLRTRLTGILYLSFPQKNVVFPQKSPVFLQRSPVFFRKQALKQGLVCGYIYPQMPR